jgi:photosystem II stability/assembly factor-like uncharacterized protein
MGLGLSRKRRREVCKSLGRPTRFVAMLTTVGLAALLLLLAYAQALGAAPADMEAASNSSAGAVSGQVESDTTVSAPADDSRAVASSLDGSLSPVDRTASVARAVAVPMVAPSLAPVPTDALHTLLAGVDGWYIDGQLYDREKDDTSWARLGQHEFASASICKLVRHPHGAYSYALIGQWAPSGKIYRSSDWGLTWQDITPQQAADAGWKDLAVDPADPTTLFAGHSEGSTGGLYKSTDGGDSWVRVWYIDPYGAPQPYGVRAIGISSIDPNLVLIAVSTNGATPAKILRSADGGDTFEDFQDGYQYGSSMHPNPGYFLMDNTDPDVAYLPLRTTSTPSTVYGGILKTTDGGDSWAWAGNASLGDGERTSFLMAQSPTDNQTIYKIGLAKQNIWRSTNGGSTWTRIVTGINATYGGLDPAWILASPRDADLLYVGGNLTVSGGYYDFYSWVYKSTNGGSNWTNFHTGLPEYRTTVNAMLLLGTEGASHYMGLCPTVAQCGDPVNTSTGNFAHQQQDLAIPGPGASLSVQRTYNSLDTYVGPLGEGWSFSYDMRLTSMAPKVVEMKVEDGRRDRRV